MEIVQIAIEVVQGLSFNQEFKDVLQFYVGYCAGACLYHMHV